MTTTTDTNTFTPHTYTRTFVQMRYFASLNPDGSGRVTFQDSMNIIDVELTDRLIPVDRSTYERLAKMDNIFYENKEFVQRNPPPPSLKDQASSAMQKAQKQASMASAMGEVFGPKMRDYVQALRAILDGSDTTSTKLPDMPSDVTM